MSFEQGGCFFAHLMRLLPVAVLLLHFGSAPETPLEHLGGHENSSPTPALMIRIAQNIMDAGIAMFSDKIYKSEIIEWFGVVLSFSFIC